MGASRLTWLVASCGACWTWLLASWGGVSPVTSLWRAVVVFVMLAAVMTLAQAALAAMQGRSPREEEHSVSSEAPEAETASQQEAA